MAHDYQDELSDLSDGKGYLYPDREQSTIELRLLRIVKTKLASVKRLYNSDKVFKRKSSHSMCKIYFFLSQMAYEKLANKK